MTSLDQLRPGMTCKVIGLLSVSTDTVRNNSVMCVDVGHTITVLRNQWNALHFRVDDTNLELVASYYAIRHILVVKI